MVCRDKKKEFAPSGAAFYPLGADLFLSPRKIDHIARFVQIPAINIPGDIPSILIVNIQVIAYFLVHIRYELGISHHNVQFFHKDLHIFVFFEMQIPLYPATIFQSENDGEGMNVILYFKLSERYSKDLSDQFRENITVSC